MSAQSRQSFCFVFFIGGSPRSPACNGCHMWSRNCQPELAEAYEFISDFSGVRVAQSLVYCVTFWRSLFVLLSFLAPLYCLSFELRPLVSSNLSYTIMSYDNIVLVYYLNITHMTPSVSLRLNILCIMFKIIEFYIARVCAIKPGKCAVIYLWVRGISPFPTIFLLILEMFRKCAIFVFHFIIISLFYFNIFWIKSLSHS